jgi:hypothetical protein
MKKHLDDDVESRLRAKLASVAACPECARRAGRVVRGHSHPGTPVMLRLCPKHETEALLRRRIPPLPPPPVTPDGRVEYHGHRRSPECLELLRGTPDHIWGLTH